MIPFGRKIWSEYDFKMKLFASPKTNIRNQFFFFKIYEIKMPNISMFGILT